MNKQIEERTCIDCIHYPVCCLWSTTDLIEDEQHKFCFGNLKTVNEFAHNAGYRRQSEVAREIFEEIEKEIIAALESNYRVYEKYLNAQDSPTLLRVGGKIDALRGIYCFIEDLKKKYGGQEDEQAN